MSKHTRGPWFYDSGAIWSESQLDPENKPYVFRGEEPLAAVMSRNPQDARLIAAAPLMLEALEELVELKDRRHSLPVEIYQAAREKAWGKCRKAIKAAKGEQEKTDGKD